MIRKIVFFFFICIFAESSIFAENAFSPWNTDVKVGDQNISIIRGNETLLKKFKNKDTFKIYDYSGSPGKDRKWAVYNGYQGGAYFLIRFFQVVISPQDGPSCRYNPVCSQYGRLAVEAHGALLGSILAGDRLLRCNPFAPHGHDPVPDKIFSDR